MYKFRQINLVLLNEKRHCRLLTVGNINSDAAGFEIKGDRSLPSLRVHLAGDRGYSLSAVGSIDFNASEGDIIGINGGVPIDILTFTPTDVNQDGIPDTIIQYTETSEIFGVYTNIFGVVINTPPDIVKSSSFSIPLNDPITQIGRL